jgi:AcrR family transcriptional regulator
MLEHDDMRRGAETATASASPVRDPEETQRRLLVAALAVFARRGYGAASVKEIVSQAGCSKGAFYNHFASKEELFLTLLESRLHRNHQRLMELCPWRGDCAQWLSDVFDTLAGFAHGETHWRALSVEFMAHGMRNPAIGKRIARMHEEFRGMVADTLRQSDVYRSGRMTVDPDMVAACLGALIDGLMIHATMDPETLPSSALADRLQPLLAAWFREAS